MERVISDEAVNITADAIQCQRRVNGTCPVHSEVLDMLLEDYSGEVIA